MKLTYPKLKENIWHIKESDEFSSLITVDGYYKVPTSNALDFMKIRSYCNGYNSIEEISCISGVDLEKTKNMLVSLNDIGVVFDQDSAINYGNEYVRKKLLSITELWSDELKYSYIANEFSSGELPKSVLIGWLIEMYHYIKDFPFAIAHSIKNAVPPLSDLLEKYSKEETGHEEFVLSTLENIGVSRDLVINSEPLPSTKLIRYMMRDLFDLNPASVLLMAEMVESQEFETENIEEFQRNLEKKYNLDTGAFAPYFKHQEIDTNLGHGSLLKDNLDLFIENDPETLDLIINKLHDLKHAFELQGQEIKQYYGDLLGKYFPRLPVTYRTL